MAVIEGLMAIHLLHGLYFSVVTNLYYNAFNVNKEVKFPELEFFFINGTQKHVYISGNKSLSNDDGKIFCGFKKWQACTQQTQMRSKPTLQ